MRGSKVTAVLAAFIFTVCGMFTFCADANADFITAQWTGTAGDGLYSSPGNWDIGAVPVDGGGNTYDVVIPTGFTVRFDLDNAQQVTNFNIAAGSTMSVDPGKSLTVLNNAKIYGVVTVSNSTFLAEAPAAQLPGNQAQLAVSGGGKIAVSAVAYSSTGLGNTYTLFSSQGTGSLLDLSDLQSINAYVSATFVQTHTISAPLVTNSFNNLTNFPDKNGS